MKTFCEIAISEFLPAARALVAKELMENYGFTQMAIAKKLKITQPAVSYYLRELRGSKVRIIQSDKEIVQWIKLLAAEVAGGKARPIDIQKLCVKLRHGFLKEKNLELCSLCSV